MANFEGGRPRPVVYWYCHILSKVAGWHLKWWSTFEEGKWSWGVVGGRGSGRDGGGRRGGGRGREGGVGNRKCATVHFFNPFPNFLQGWKGREYGTLNFYIEEKYIHSNFIWEKIVPTVNVCVHHNLLDVLSHSHQAATPVRPSAIYTVCSILESVAYCHQRIHCKGIPPNAICIALSIGSQVLAMEPWWQIVGTLKL